MVKYVRDLLIYTVIKQTCYFIYNKDHS
jgi:hypothetical protein